MTYSLREAAEAVGKGKPAVLKAIKSGRISATRNELGEWQIEPVELHRVYPPVSKEPASETGSKERKETIGNPNGNSLLTQEVQFLREKLADLERMSDEQRRQLSDQIEDLRRDREDMRTERDRLLKVIEEQAGSMKLLTDQREKAEAEIAAPGLVVFQAEGGIGEALGRVSHHGRHRRTGPHPVKRCETQVRLGVPEEGNANPS